MKSPLLIAALSACTLSFASADQRQVSVTIRVKDGRDTLSLPSVTAKQNAPFQIAVTRDFRFPTTWALPERQKQPEGHTIAIPLTPESFEKIDAGITFRCTADSVEGLIRLAGSATYTEVGLAQAVFGEHSKPIYSDDGKILLSPNKGPSAFAQSSVSYFQLFAKPGQTYEIKIRRLNRWIPCLVTCDYGRATFHPSRGSKS